MGIETPAVYEPSAFVELTLETAVARAGEARFRVAETIDLEAALAKKNVYSAAQRQEAGIRGRPCRRGSACIVRPP